MKRKLISSLFVFVCCFWTSGLSAAQIDGKGFQQIKIGDIEAIILTDGHVPISPIQPAMAPAVDSKQLADFMTANGNSSESLDLAINMLLLKKDDKLILFDTGQGSLMGGEGRLKKNLSAIGISPEQITDIVITHAHLDHIGGLIDANGKSVFPNANIYMTKIEYDFWTGGNPDFSKSKNKNDEMIKTMVQISANILTTLKPQIKFVEDKATILGCIEVRLAPGHTYGHIITTISSKGDKIVAIADVIHASSILFAHPEWGTGFDTDFDLGVKTRLEVLKDVSANKALIFGYHLPYPGIGHVKEIGTNSYEWIPASFASPQLNQ